MVLEKRKEVYRMFAYCKALFAMRILRQARREYYNAFTVYGLSMPAYYYAMYNVELSYKKGVINSSCYNYIRKQIYNLYRYDYSI